MLDHYFQIKQGTPFPSFLYDLALDLFCSVQYWEPSAKGAQRGRLFEDLFYRYCHWRGLALSERAGSRTFRGEPGASGFQHESDGVIAHADVSVHVEMKHLGEPVSKNDLLIFNQKGLDFLMGESSRVRRLPLYRVFVSGGLLSPAARQFAAQWGILAIEPDRLPLLLLHQIAGVRLEGCIGAEADEIDEIWDEVPYLVVPLQERVHRLAQILQKGEVCLTEYRLDRALNHLQRNIGDAFWTYIDGRHPEWLQERFEQLDGGIHFDDLGRTCESFDERLPARRKVDLYLGHRASGTAETGSGASPRGRQVVAQS